MKFPARQFAGLGVVVFLVGPFFVVVVTLVVVFAVLVVVVAAVVVDVVEPAVVLV